MALSQHSPTSAIIAQIRQHDPAVVESNVWSFYAPPEGRSPATAFRAVNCGYRVMTERRDRVDSRVLIPLVRQLRAYRPDVLHCHFVRANIYGRLAARVAGVPVVINTLRGVDDYLVEATLGSRVVRLVERRSLPLVSRYVTVSEAVRRNAIATLGIQPDRIVTILNAVELDPFVDVTRDDRAAIRRELDLRDDAIVIASVGVLRPLKNHALAIRMLSELRGRVTRPIQLVVAGDGEDLEGLRAMAAALDLDESVRIPGLIRDIPRLLRGIDISVLFSFSEGLPRAIMEAMASGIPCVVSDTGGLPEAVVDGKTGYVCALADVGRIRDCLEQLIVRPQLRARMGAAGREIAFSRFSPVRLASDYAALYFDLLSERMERT